MGVHVMNNTIFSDQLISDQLIHDYYYCMYLIRPINQSDQSINQSITPFAFHSLAALHNEYIIFALVRSLG